MVKIIIFGLMLFSTTAFAGTMTCTSNFNIPLYGIFSMHLSTCNMSNSYSLDGESFPGTGTATENAAQLLCGTAVSTIVQVIVSPTGTSAGVQFTYNPPTGKLIAFLPTNLTNATWTFAGTSATPTGTNSAPLLTVTGGQGVGVGLQIDSDANGAVLGKITATDRTGITGIQAPTLTMNSFTPAGTVTADLATTKNSGIEVPAGQNGSSLVVGFLSVCSS